MAGAFESLTSLVRRATGTISENVIRDLLCSVAVFPRTSSLADDKPIALYVHKPGEKSYNWERIKAFVKSNPELISIGARDDLDLILQLLQNVEEELNLIQFDYIQIYRSGVDLLRIVNEERSVNRSVYIEINEYRRRLHKAIYPDTRRDDYASILTNILVGAVGSILTIAAYRYWFQK